MTRTNKGTPPTKSYSTLSEVGSVLDELNQKISNQEKVIEERISQSMDNLKINLSQMIQDSNGQAYSNISEKLDSLKMELL